MSQPGPAPQLRPLNPRDEPHLEAFTCRDLTRPYTAAIEDTIRTQLAAQVAAGRVETLSAWVDGTSPGTGATLCGVVAWRVAGGVVVPVVAHIDVLATSVGYQRRGIGRLLKGEVVERARGDGAAAVASVIHRDNRRMFDLNARLGAVIEETSDPEHLRCIIPLV